VPATGIPTCQAQGCVRVNLTASPGSDVEQPNSLCATMTLFTKPEIRNIITMLSEDQATATGNMHKKFGEDQMRSSRDIITDRQTNTHTHTHTDRQTDTLITIFCTPISGAE